MMKFLELFVFWYPATMSIIWIIGSIIFYFRIENKKPLSLNESPMVSVLVPCYNEAETIIDTLDKLNALDYPQYEIIAINDGSSDNTFEVLCELSARIERLRIINLINNSGKANALYHGLIASNGEYLVCVDADSYLAPDALNMIIPHFITPNSGERVGAVTGNPRVRNRNSLIAKIQLCEYSSIIGLIKRTQKILGKVMIVSGVVVAYRKRALIDSKFWDKDMITEDIAVTWKIQKNYWDVRYEPRAICWMLVPEKIKGFWKQRIRWAQGGLEVMARHFNIFKSWRERRLYLVFSEQVLSIVWAACWVYLFILGMIQFVSGNSTFMPYFWKSQFLSFICIIQFLFAMKLDSKYDKHLLKYGMWAIWYPILFWYMNAAIVLVAIPKTIFRKRKKYAVWESPDRGLKDAKDKK